MPIVLYRVDERLIHGQVVVGWSHLDPDRIIVVDDALASSTWEQDLYSMGLPPTLATRFCTVAVARDELARWRSDETRVLILTRDLNTMRRLAEGRLLAGEKVNIGGIHYADGREAVLPYVYLSDAERGELQRLADEGADVSARDLPNTRAVGLDSLLSES